MDVKSGERVELSEVQTEWDGCLENLGFLRDCVTVDGEDLERRQFSSEVVDTEVVERGITIAVP